MCKAVSKVEAAAAVKARGGGEQFNGREGETAFVSVGEYLIRYIILLLCKNKRLPKTENYE
jgi:hypothetical protein